MKTLTALTISLFASVGTAHAEAQLCEKGGDVRTLEVLKPGVVGKACDLRYTYNNGATVKTPYHANNSVGFCGQKAETLLAELRQSGFTCNEVATTVTASVAEPAPSATPSADAAVAQALETVPETAAASVAQAAPSEITSPAPATIEEAATPASAPAQIQDVAQDVAQDVTESAAEQSIPEPTTSVAEAPAAELSAPSATIEEPAIEVAKVENNPASSIEPAPASQGPVTLTKVSEVPVNARRPKKSAVGRLLGAEPDEVTEPTLATTARPIRVAATTTASTPEVPALEAPKVEKLRPSPEVIKGILAAQSAAWNEGDLEAFMGGYWKSADLRLSLIHI